MRADDDRIHATYLVETPGELGRAVRALASEGSTGTFVAVPGEDGAVKTRFGTRLEAVEALPDGDVLHLIGARGAAAGATVHRARVTISVPLELTGTDLTTVGACLLGNVFELSEVSGLRLEDVAFPGALLRAAPRPRHGIQGTRAALGVHDRPIFGTIVRPGLGLTPGQTAAAVRTLLDAGIDVVKDDELLGSPPYSPLPERVAAVQREIEDHAQRTGRRAAFIYNITDEPDAMLRHQDVVRAAGGCAVQVNVLHAGLAGVAHLRRHGDLILHAHRSGWALQTRSAGLGMSYRAHAKLWRLAGADHLIVAGLRNKYWEPDASSLDAVGACLEPLLDEGDRALPVLAAGQGPEQVPDTATTVGTPDWMLLAGGAVTGHPQGPAAGVRALFDALGEVTA